MESGNQAQESKKPFSYAEIYDQIVNHIANLAMSPHTIEHARWRTKELMNDSSGLFGNIATDVKAKIDEIRSKS